MKRATMKWGTWVPLVERLRGAFEVRLRRTEPRGHWPDEHPGPITNRPEATQGATGGQVAVEYLLATLAFIVVFSAMYGFLQNSLRRLFTAAAKIIAKSYY